MVDVDIENLEGEEEVPQEAGSAAEVTEELVKMQEKKQEKKEQSKEIKKEKPGIDMSKLNAFKDKVIKEFGLEEKVDNHGCSGLYYKGFIVLKLLPRKNCWYGVWREVPKDDNKWRAFRVKDEQGEKETYDHIKLFIQTNSKGD